MVLATLSVTGGKQRQMFRVVLGVVDPLALFFVALCGIELRVFGFLLPRETPNQTGQTYSRTGVPTGRQLRLTLLV